MAIVPSEEVINDVLDKCSDAAENGSAYPGMTYEEGLKDAILWLQGHEENPLGEV